MKTKTGLFRRTKTVDCFLGIFFLIAQATISKCRKGFFSGITNKCSAGNDLERDRDVVEGGGRELGPVSPAAGGTDTVRPCRGFRVARAPSTGRCMVRSWASVHCLLLWGFGQSGTYVD